MFPSLPAWIALLCVAALGAFLARLSRALDDEARRMEPRGERPDTTERERAQRPLAGTALR